MDEIVHAAAAGVIAHRMSLARLASIEETKMGIMEDKVRGRFGPPPSRVPPLAPLVARRLADRPESHTYKLLSFASSCVIP